MKSFANAHIVKSDDKEELWLGKSTIIHTGIGEVPSAAIISSLHDFIDVDFLKEERQVILELREAQYYMPSKIEKVLRRNEPIDALLKCLCLPVLIAYDSPSLLPGFFDNYHNALKKEVLAYYDKIKGKLNISLSTIRVHIFFLPSESCKQIIAHFSNALK